MALHDEPMHDEEADWESGWIGAAVIFALATLAAVVILGGDWQQSQGPDEFSLPESKRTMLMAPLPR